MTAMRFLCMPAALALAAAMIGNAAVQAWSQAAPANAAKVWRSHPAVQVSLGMTEIAEAARRGKAAPEASLASIVAASVKAPLAPEPFLVRGVALRLGGDTAGAISAFHAAERRDPRSLPARYFLAELYLRNGDVGNGLREFASLADIAPQGVVSVAPYVAATAADRRNWGQIRTLFARNPGIADATLVLVAQDPRNADAVLALATGPLRSVKSRWVNPLLTQLIAAGQRDRALAIWSALTNDPGAKGALLRDSKFERTDLQSPFGWMLAGAQMGMADVQPRGRLHLIFYGQQDGALAKQLLTLAPGSYRFKLHLAGGAAHPELLSWTIQCDGTNHVFSSAPLSTVAGAGWRFDVPAGCGGQWLQLNGTSGDVPQQADVIISDLQLTREGTGA